MGQHIMNVGGVGAMGIAGGGLSVGASSAISMGGLNGPLGNFNAAGLSGTRMDQLVELMNGFSTAEILIALMLATGSKRDRDRCGDAGLGMLLGLSLASQLGQMTPQFCFQSPEMSAVATGQMINLTA